MSKLVISCTIYLDKVRSKKHSETLSTMLKQHIPDVEAFTHTLSLPVSPQRMSEVTLYSFKLVVPHGPKRSLYTHHCSDRTQEATVCVMHFVFHYHRAHAAEQRLYAIYGRIVEERTEVLGGQVQRFIM